jgi:hypothetical protein
MPLDHQTRKQAVPAARWSPALRRLGAGLTAAVTLLAVGLRPTDAAVMLASGTTLPGQAYMDYGAQFQNSILAIRYVTSLGNIRHSSAVQIDARHVLTAAHVLDSIVGFRPPESVSVLTGTNFLNPTSETSIRRYKVHPTYIPGSFLGVGSQIDLIVIELDEPLQGRGVSIRLSPVPNGETISFAGFGQHALPYQPLQPQDGSLRGFKAVSAGAASQFDDYFYGNGNSGSPTPNSGYAANHDSGGGAYFNGELTGIMTGAAGGTDPIGATTYLDITRPEIRAFIAEFRASSVGGGLGFRLADLNITPAGGGQGPRVSGKVHGGAGQGSIRIEACSTLGTGAVWETLGTLTLDQSGSATFADLLDNRPEAATATRTFYRAATVP